MVQASPVGLHMREDKVIVISKAVYIWATSLTSALGTSLLRWASELQCRPCAGEHVCARPWEAMAHLSPAHSVSAVPQPLLCGSLLRGSPAHPQAGQAGHPCTAGTHRLTLLTLLLPLMPQVPLVSRGNELKRSHYEMMVQGMQSTAVERLLCCNDIHLFVAGSYQALHWAEAWPCS